MGESTKISWSDATFNPWWGCARVSPGCNHCYAETFAKRTGNLVWGKDAERRRFGDKHWAEPLKWNDAAERAGRPALVFCASMADVFEDRPDHVEDRARLWVLIRDTPWLEWQLLTKRPENVLRMVPRRWLADWPGHVWIGTTVEDQQRALDRLPHLLQVPAEVRFVSCEPLLGRVRLPWSALNCDHDSTTGLDNIPLGSAGNRWRCDVCGQVQLEVDDPDGTAVVSTIPASTARRVRYDTLQPGRLIDWVIVGGESGPGHRALDLDHARALRDQCAEEGVPFLFKQVGGRHPTSGGDLLDGVQHKAFPARARQ
jgi:protein gp37